MPCLWKTLPIGQTYLNKERKNYGNTGFNMQ